MTTATRTFQRRPGVETHLMTCGTRALFEIVEKPLKGRFEVRGATSGHIIHTYVYDERRTYSDERLAVEGCTPEATPQAYKNLKAVILGKTRQSQKEAATAKTIATSSVVTRSDQ